MCGIVGFFTTGRHPWSRQLDDTLLSRMQERLRHRGRDARGSVYCNRKILRLRVEGKGEMEKPAPVRTPFWRLGLGHQRLTIVDQSIRGTQPLPNEDDTIFVVCNGEVYNHKSLRRQLETKGHQFRSDSDSETIVHLYEEYGIGGFEQMVGPNGFGLWDSRRNVFILHRDRFGEKPLFYYFQDGTFVFASEIKAFMEIDGFPLDVSPEAVESYLTFGHIVPPYTWFQHLRKVKPGHMLIFDGFTLQDRLAWTPRWPSRIKRSLETCLAEFGPLFKEVVSEVGYVEPEIQCGIPLSGGIDSSLVTLYAHDGGLAFDKFTLYDKNSKALEDELSRARFVSSFTPGRHVVIKPEPNVPSLLEICARFIDEPISSLVDVAIRYSFYKELGRHVRVSLGAGFGDFVFQSLARFHDTMRRDSGWPANPFVRIPLRAVARRLLPDHVRRRASSRIFIPEEFGAAYFEAQSGGYRSLLGMESSGALACDLGRSVAELRPGDFTAAMLLLSMVSLRQYTLYQDDHIGLYYGLEARDPFLDVRLVQFALGLPFDLLIPDYRERSWNPVSPTNKFLLRKVLERKVGPKPVVVGAKYGWGKDKDEITAYQLEVSVPGAWYDITENEFLLERCHLNPSEVVRLFHAYLARPEIAKTPHIRLALYHLSALNIWTRFHSEYQGSTVVGAPGSVPRSHAVHVQP